MGERGAWWWTSSAEVELSQLCSAPPQPAMSAD